MSFSWNLHTPNGPTPRDTSTNPSPFTNLLNKPRSACLDITVPTGIVASRVSYLQSLGSSARNTGPPPPESQHYQPRHSDRRGDSRGGFGLRTCARFGYPACRNERPDEDPPAEKGHSFLGLHKWKFKHDGHHVDTDKKVGYGEMAKGFPRRFEFGDLGEEERPEGIKPRATGAVPTTVKRRAKKYRRYAQDGVFNSAAKPNPTRRLRVASPSAVLSRLDLSTQKQDESDNSLYPAQAIDEWIGNMTSEPPRPEDSAIHSKTTTTIRRIRSVREMFSFYGIEEPTGLFPPQLHIYDAAARQSLGRKKTCYHICRRFNGGMGRCSYCGHWLCDEREKMEPDAAPHLKGEAVEGFDIFEDGGDEEEVDMKMKDPRASGMVYTPSEYEQENWMCKSPMQAPAKISSPKSSRAKAHQTTFPTTFFGSLPDTPKSLTGTVTADYPSPLRPSATLNTAPAPNNRSTVKDSPFIIADQQQSTQRLISEFKKIARPLSYHNHHRP